MSSINRRKFLQSAGIAGLPILIPTHVVLAGNPVGSRQKFADPVIRFFGDAVMLEPGDYIHELQKCNGVTAIVKDRYGAGGVIEALEKKFASLTGKEKAIFMPSGTMANQLAIAVLSEENPKVFVQDTSHVYRDEADAAQSVFQKRLMPLAKGETFFSARQLQDAIESLGNEEVFESGIGAVSIENPVRRTDGRMIPLEEIKKISSFCRSKKIPMHLDGARIFIASGWSGIPVKEYASHFDTVYISLYKYLGASAGAMLCGDKSVIDKMPHLMKVHGGSMFGNWTNAAIALGRIDGIKNKFDDVVKRVQELLPELNKLDGIQVKPLENGTNIYSLELSVKINGKLFQERLNKEHNIRIPGVNEKNSTLLTMNETLFYKSVAQTVDAFRQSL